MRASVYATMLLVFVLGTPAAAGGLFHTAQAVDPAAPATPAPVPPSPPPDAVPGPASSPQKLVGIAAWNQLIGNSIAGTENGEPQTCFGRAMSNGSGSSLACRRMSGASSGWTIAALSAASCMC